MSLNVSDVWFSHMRNHHRHIHMLLNIALECHHQI